MAQSWLRRSWNTKSVDVTRFLRRLLAALPCGTAIMLSPPRLLLAQNTSTMTVAYTASSPAAPTDADFQLGRFIIGFADVNVTNCGSNRRRCQVRMSVVIPPVGIVNMRYIISAALPSLASCATAMPIGPSILGSLVIDMLATETIKSARVYFCYDLTWLGTAAGLFAPSVEFLLQQGVP